MDLTWDPRDSTYEIEGLCAPDLCKYSLNVSGNLWQKNSKEEKNTIHHSCAILKSTLWGPCEKKKRQKRGKIPKKIYLNFQPMTTYYIPLLLKLPNTYPSFVLGGYFTFSHQLSR